jgi:hypothetical protein
MQFTGCVGSAGLALFITVAVLWTIIRGVIITSLLLSCIGLPCFWTYLTEPVWKAYDDPVYSRCPLDPLIKEILTELRILDHGTGVTAIEIESLHFVLSLFDRRSG